MCTHQFIRIDEKRKIPPAVTTGTNLASPRFDANVMIGALVGCPLCGDTRTIWSNGDVDIHGTAVEE